MAPKALVQLLFWDPLEAKTIDLNGFILTLLGGFLDRDYFRY